MQVDVIKGKGGENRLVITLNGKVRRLSVMLLTSKQYICGPD